ncbi:hypothetical protein [Filimonas effusa]|uniref:Uncharacterized protein n=1 Tax=Filimonas effusa TaxID=2508721 RepID=A0A4Q1D7P6_9BACT|nr:hypothetical protein [Filimonas effusa]RXK85317.1 hypothetical protein ESB13_00380 [Filimonas effusa]
MAKQGGPFIFEKTFGCVSLYKRGGIGLARCKSNLTAQRWRKDPAFAGSRKSAGELGAAAAIASPFYNALPQGIRVFSLYHQLVGLAKKLLAAGAPIDDIEQTLALAVIRLRKMEITANANQAGQKHAGQNLLSQKQVQKTSTPSRITAAPGSTKPAAPSVKVLLSHKVVQSPGTPPLYKESHSAHISRHKSLCRRTAGRSASVAALLPQRLNTIAAYKGFKITRAFPCPYLKNVCFLARETNAVTSKNSANTRTSHKIVFPAGVS